MSHGILMNRFTAKIDYNLIDQNYDIFRISDDDSKDYKRSNILDIPNLEYKALSVQYTYGKVAFVLFAKGIVNESKFTTAIQERFKDACVQKLDITNADDRKSYYLYDNILIQLFANAIRVPKNELFSYNNTTGKLYYLTPKWKRKKSFYCIEIKLEKGNIIKLYVRSFREKSKNDKSTGLVFDPMSGELRKKLSSDKNVMELIPKSDSNRRNTVDFLCFNSANDFYHSKLGILHRFLKDMDKEYGKYITLTLDESENTYDYELPKSEKADKIYLKYGKLLNNEVNITDEVKTGESELLIHKIQNELSEFYGINTTVGELSSQVNNIRIIHDADYYKDNNMPDPHNNISKDFVVQHMIIEESKHLEINKNNKKPSVDIKKIIQELIIKQDIKNGKISCFDWETLCYDKSVTFVSCDKIKKDDEDTNKNSKDYLYKIMNISPDGTLDFRALDTRDFLNDADLQLITIFDELRDKYAKYPDSMEGIMVTDDNYSAIVRTACTTMPNIYAIAESLEHKPFSKETIYDAVSAFKEEMPMYANYADDVIKKLKMENELTYSSVNSCLNLKTKSGSALNRFIYANYGIRINPEFKNRDNDEEYYLKNICNIRYYYEKTWDAKEALVYYVGAKRSNLQTSLHNACVIRKVYSDSITPEADNLFPLMTVEFVRNEQYTVIPFPFKYLREYSV